MDVQEQKRQAAERAVEYIESGMVVGLGHGSTAIFAVQRLATLIKDGILRDIVAIPCSKAVEQEARHLEIPLTTFATHPHIDITIDGADEVDSNLNLIKGGGGALLREKIVAQASQREIIVVDEGKLSSALGTRFDVPVEVVSFGWQSQTRFLEDLGAVWRLRLDNTEQPLVTDQGNFILDCQFGPIDDPIQLGQALDSRAVIVEHGLFLGLATEVIVGAADGLRYMRR
ncbi:MAG: ribose-5-phosphate isomerase RpiA [Anaerolineales bacterium]|nr:ribose-5-phosphate isomerase RpiA [Anaerolineales bacterium]